MKLGTINYHDKETIIAQTDGGKIMKLASAYSAANFDGTPNSMLALIKGGRKELSRAQKAVQNVTSEAINPINEKDLDWLAPQPHPSKIFGVAFNNKRLMETAHKDPQVPNFFLKPPSCLTGHLKPIEVRSFYGATIPECELAAVIGRRAKNISAEKALDYIFGYSIMNDVTSHQMKFSMDSVAVTRPKEIWAPYMSEWRHVHREDDRDLYFVYHSRSKGADTFGPCGPWITTADEVVDPNDLQVEAWINGEQFADDHTSSYRFKIQEVIAEASRFFTLEPGDLFSFGTTAKGVGRFPHAHRNIDLSKMTGIIEIQISGLGCLSNPISHIE